MLQLAVIAPLADIRSESTHPNHPIHREAVRQHRPFTRLRGLGLSTIGRLFAAACNANLDRAIPNLIAEYAELAQGVK